MTTERSDQIGIDEIKRRVDESLDKVLAEIEALPELQRPTTVRQIAKYVGRDIDENVAAAVFREGLVRIVRRLMRVRNKAKQSRRAKGKGK